MHFADESAWHSKRDSVLVKIQNFMKTIASAVSSIDAILALKSVDKNEHWALFAERK